MKKKAFLEHVNISVENIEECLSFLKTAFPSFYVRGGDGEGQERWVRFGDEDSYVALSYGALIPPVEGPNYRKAGFNHLGFVVNDIDDLAIRLDNKGYKRNYPDQVEKYRKRVYFLDTEGNEYEFVEYYSTIDAEKNSYAEE